MSRALGSFQTLAYRGAPIAQPIQQCLVPAMPPKVCRFDIDWITYWNALGQPTQLGIDIDVTAGSTTANIIDTIRCIKIDNTNSLVPIYIQFKDTLDVITCAPNTVVTLPVMTNLRQFTVYAAGLTTGFIPTTKLFIANVLMQSNIDPEIQTTFPQWKGSPAIQRNNLLTPGYASPALCDQAINHIFVGNQTNGTPFQQTVLPASVNVGTFWYIGAMSFYIGELTSTVGVNQYTRYVFRLYDQNSGADIYRFQPIAFGGFTTGAVRFLNGPIMTVSGLNFRLPASHAIGIQMVSCLITATLAPPASFNYDVATFIGYTENS